MTTVKEDSSGIGGREKKKRKKTLRLQKPEDGGPKRIGPAPFAVLPKRKVCAGG